MAKSPTDKTLTREDLVNHIAVRIAPRSDKQLRWITDKLIECLSDALHQGKTVYLGPVGKMHVKRKAARPASVYGAIDARIAITVSKSAPEDKTNKYLRSDLLIDVQKKARMNSREARDILTAWESFLDLVLTHNYRIEFRDFGVFYPRHYEERACRNPQKNIQIMAPAKTVVAFKLSRKLRLSVEKVLFV